MKICSKCKEEKSLSEYHNKRLNSGNMGLQPWCKECYRKHHRDKWSTLDNSENRIKKGINQKIRRDRNRQFVWDYLKSRHCEQCSESNPILLEFDHIDPKEKLMTVSKVVGQTLSISRILSEIAKCRILCVKCHRLHTCEQLGWYKGLT
jgi:hypothetical protein